MLAHYILMLKELHGGTYSFLIAFDKSLTKTSDPQDHNKNRNIIRDQIIWGKSRQHGELSLFFWFFSPLSLLRPDVKD